MKAKKKRGVEAPPRIRAFINSALSSPLESIDVPLSAFNWDYEKGDFYHWVDLLNHFDTFFEKYVKPRNDLHLVGDILEVNGPPYKEGILQVLRVTRIVLENCMSKYLYSSTEHLSTLLSSTDPEVVIAALQTLAAFVKRPVQSNRPVRWHGDSGLNARLFSLSQGWGGKEQGLGLVGCATEHEFDRDAYNLGTTLHFEFYGEGKMQPELEHVASGLQAIHISNLHMRTEGDLEILKQLVDEYNVPDNLRFSLLTRIRFARAFPYTSLRRKYTCIRLLAFTVLLQSNPDHGDLAAFFLNEPEFVNELVTLLQCEDTVPEDIRILAILTLAAQSHDRPRQSNVLSAISAGHRGMLPSLMQKAIGSLTGMFGGSVAFVEALLALVTVLVSSSSGCAALREAGLISTLLPLLKDTDAHHLHLVTLAVHILEAFMDYSNPAGTLFRDLGGLDDTIGRLKLEVSRIEHTTSKQVHKSLTMSEKGKAVAVDDEEHQQMPTSGQAETMIPYQQRLLLKALLRAIALGTYAPGNMARLHGSEESALPACLCTIFKHAKVFGGGVFSLAASVMSDLIHKDPTCFPALDKAGLPKAFLDAISNGVLPSSEALGCIPNTLDAICLSNSGLKEVKDRNAIGCFVKIFTSKMYVRALANDTPVSLASGLDELMRHAPSLRGPGIDMCIEILKSIAAMGGTVEVQAVVDLKTTYSPVPMDTDIEDRSVISTAAEDLTVVESSQQPSEVATESSHTNVESFLPEIINNTVRLLETILQNADTSRIFIEKKGIEALLQLYTLSYLPVSFGGSSTSHSISGTFRAFPAQHASALARAVCGVLKDHLKLTIDILMPTCCKKLSDLEIGVRTKVLRSLSAVECFLSLSAVLVKSSAAMMAEISTGGAEILNDIGRVHREVLWQIALIAQAKVESEREADIGTTVTSTASGPSVMGTGSRENEDETDSFPVVRYVNPVTIRNGPARRWGVDPEFLPVIQAGEGLHRRARRDHMTTEEALAEIVRFGWLARHASSSQIELEASVIPIENQLQETCKRKSPETMNYEMMTRLAMAARGLYVALGKAIVVPTRRRDDVVPLSVAAKSVVTALVRVIGDNLSFDCNGSSVDFEASISVKCRYLGKVVDDVVAVLLDSRRRACNTIIVNNLYAHGIIRTLLRTFVESSELLGKVLQNVSSSMETENKKAEDDKVEGKVEPPVWLLDALQSYAKLLEYLVCSSLLLTPPSAAQLLVQPVEGGSVPLPKDPEVLVRALQAQVLEAVLPVWSHPKLSRCPPTFVMSIASIITHVYTGTGDIKRLRNAPAGVGTRLGGPPPDESLISTIAEMGFSRARAEVALRHVETNSVELAMEWLFSHPEEAVQEDDELARAVALSLGNPDGSQREAEAAGKGKEVLVEEGPEAPPVEKLLDTCMTLMQTTDALAFSITDLLVTISNRERGQDRPRVISYFVQQLSDSNWKEADSGYLSAVSHLLALSLSEDNAAREVAAQNGLVNVALDGLSHFIASNFIPGVKVEVPKWVTSLLLVLDHMLQYKPKISAGTPLGTVGSSTSAAETSDRQIGEAIDAQQEKNLSPFASIIGKPTGYMEYDEQQRAMSIACNLLSKQLPAACVQAVLQFCARLTKVHSIAMQYLEAGGLNALLALPRNCLFPGFDTVANAIIRHLLEDPQTLLQAMESEIRHALTSASARHNGRVSPRVFLTVLAPVLSREPTVFMQAVTSICQIDNVGGRMSIVLAKDKEKERDKEKDKSQEKEKEKEREKVKLGSSLPHEGFLVEASGKLPDGLVKSVKGHKKVPHSFSQVIDQLLEVILYYPPVGKDGEPLYNAMPSETAMEVDELTPKQNEKGNAHGKGRTETSQLFGLPAATAKVTFILKLMSEVLLMYSSAVTVVLRRDFESSQGKGPSQGGADVGHGGLLYHILHRLLPYPSEKVNKVDEDWREKLSDKAAYFLMAVCIRSGEGKRRVVQEIAKALNAGAYTSNATAQYCLPPNRKVHAFVDLVNSILSSHSSCSGTQSPGLSADMAKAMVDAGIIPALSQTLQVVDLDHPDSPKLVNAILKALEALTRAASSVDPVSGSEGPDSKKVSTSEMLGNSAGLTGDEQMEENSGNGLRSNVGQTGLLVNDRIQMTHSGANNRIAQAEHDVRPQGDFTGGTHLAAEGEGFIRGVGGVELEDATAEITFRIDTVGGEEDEEDDDEEEMDGDDAEDGDEDEEEDEEDEGDIEGDEAVPHLSPPDTDVEDHDNGLGDDFEEDMVEEEVEDDEWQEDQVIEVRWRDGLTGLNHVQVLGPGAGGNLGDIPGDTFPRLNVDDVFGSFRRMAGGERRRLNNYRPFSEATAVRGGAFHHPLLTRPSQSSATGSVGAGSNSLWASAGNAVRDAEAILSGGLDASHFYMYDGPVLAEHAGDGFFSERGVGGPPPPLLDFSMDSVYLMGRRGGRSDTRLSSWTDDGQPQPGAHAAALAQALEEHFIAQLRCLLPSENLSAPETADVVGPTVAEDAERIQMDAVETMEGSEPDSATQLGGGEQHEAEGEDRSMTNINVSNPDINAVAQVATSSLVQDCSDSSRAGTCVEIAGAVTAAYHSNLDVQMQDDRSESVRHDVEVTSQDSDGSGATVGESLRSLEVEIGSVDGHDEAERPIGPERMAVGDVPSARGRETSRRLGALNSIESQEVDEEMDGPGAASQRADDGTVEGSAMLSRQQESTVPSQVEEPIQDEADDSSRTDRANSMTAIDPTFLEALPEELRAEVLASQQTQPFRAADQALPPADIDPEFLAALPPDIQAEVLAQQRAQRVIQVHVEGQPAEMDSASILATFPAELREEVLLTSSEAVLAALPPALLAEAQLLRQRVTQQYQTRNLFGGSHRIGSRRNSLNSAAGGHATIDHGTGGASSFGAGRRAGLPFSGETKMKEAEGKPLVDTAALKAMLRLLRLAQPLGKGLLQRLLLNLCAHKETRATLVQLLLDMLRPEAEGISGLYSADGAPLQRLYGCQWNVVYARSEQSDGLPPLVSRHVLEILTYLARNHALVANLLLFMEPVRSACLLDSEVAAMRPVADCKEDKGKGKMRDSASSMDTTEGKPKPEIPLILFLKFLSQPLFIRSSAHLEQVLGLLEVVTSNAGAKTDFKIRFMSSDSVPTAPERNDHPSTLPSEEESSRGGAEIPSNESASEAALEAEPSRPIITGDKGGVFLENQEASTSAAKMDVTDILLSLPEPELRNLCSLLARDGLSDMAYTRVAEVLKKLALAAFPHRQLFIMELANAGKNLSGVAIHELQCLRDTELLLLSGNSVAGAAILRVLQALSALIVLHSPPNDKDKEEDEMLEREREDSMLIVRELNLALEPLWQELSLCVGRMEGRLGSISAFSALSNSTGPGAVAAPLPLGTQKVLPFVEAFFVLCDKLRPGPAPSAQNDFSSATALDLKRAASCSDGLLPADSVALLSKPSTSYSMKVDERGMTFMRFAEKHRRLLNAFVRQNPGLLEKSLSLLIKSPRLIDFDNKRAYFRSRIRHQNEQHHFAPLRICVRRAYALEDSYNQLRMRTPEELKGRLNLQFQGEEGIDAGGLTREWYQLLSRVTFDKGALLFTTVGNESTFQPNPNSVYQTEHLSYFKFIGRVVAKALFDGQLLDVYFTRSFYKHILGVKITYQDIEAIDPDYYKNLKWMLEHDITEVLDLSFSIDADEEKRILYEKTEVTDCELIPGGRNIRVTEENKHEYVDLVTEHRLTTAIKPQIGAFMDGFRDLISVDLINIFNDKELELLISGLPEIDLEDLKSNTEYTGYTAASPVVQWFWEVVRAFSKEDMARLLQFITGTSKVPLEGFRALQGISGPQKFQIHKAYGAPKRLPSAHTCFNQLDLPDYPSKELLQERLLLAIHEASEGFGFG